MHQNPAGAVLMGAIEGTSLSAEESSFFASRHFAGITLFGRNIEPGLENVSSLCESLQGCAHASSHPLLIAIDQEGGRVSRLGAPFPNQGPPMNLADGAQTPEAMSEIEGYGRLVGEQLRVLGINVNFAPVMDILTNADNTAIGDRCFGVDAQTVSIRAGAFLRGMQSQHIAGCLKHFPGQGQAAVDTHLGTAVVDIEEDELFKRELRPFVDHLAEAPMIMIAHAIYSAFDSLPASCSPAVMQDLLRRRLGYNGVIVSDDMNMHAIPQDRQSWTDAILTAIAAGADLILVCRHLERCQWAFEAIEAEAARSKPFKARLDDAASRVLRLRSTLV